MPVTQIVLLELSTSCACICFHTLSFLSVDLSIFHTAKMRVTLFVTSLIAAVAALPAVPAPAGDSALAKRVEFANDDFEIKEEADFVYALHLLFFTLIK